MRSGPVRPSLFAEPGGGWNLHGHPRHHLATAQNENIADRRLLGDKRQKRSRVRSQASSQGKCQTIPVGLNVIPKMASQKRQNLVPYRLCAIQVSRLVAKMCVQIISC